MRFASKSTNLHIILRQGLPAEPMLGKPATPAISVRFKDGAAEVKDESLIEMMLAHPGFNSDFISIEERMGDPYGLNRVSSEPDHIITEMAYGTPTRKTVGPGPQLSPELKQLIAQEAQSIAKPIAIELAKAMLPSLLEEAMKGAKPVEENDVPAPIVQTPDPETTQSPEEPEKPVVKTKAKSS